MTHPLAVELNETLRRDNPYVLGMLSELGRDLYFPKGILTQSAEAKQRATRCNATIGIARQGGQAMHLEAVMKHLAGLEPDEALTYAPSPGRPDLRAKWGEQLRRKNPSLADKAISLPVVTAGITHGLSIVADMFVDPDNVVLLPEPFWGNYRMIFQVRRRAEIQTYPLLDRRGGGFDRDGFRRALAEHAARKKLIVVLNFPHNPTGYSLTRAEAEAACEAVVATAAERDCDVVAVCDDAYFGLFYEPEVLPESVFARLAGRHETVLA
ncbi:MAG TPA: aminotransferase class I/II-fold pyridoxal phosphate-dependent enzyme, partial [Planctomycetaceae bacterium]|nr:aminotransferase class I/II-fold pyridoxal phosphate-dependent enzyme [Planctomycetaceae bacterium]